MFGRKKKDEFIWTCHFLGRTVNTDEDGYNALQEVHRELARLKSENMALKGELESIKPVLESPDYKPPKSRECSDCQYAVYSPWDNISVIGCRKDCLCEDFKPKKED